MTQSQLSAQDVAGAIRDLHRLHSRATSQLASQLGYVEPNRKLSLSERTEIDRLCLTHGDVLSVPDLPVEQDFRGSRQAAAREAERIAASHSDVMTGRSRRDSQLLALSSGGATQGLISKYGVPVTYAGQPVADTPQNRIAFGRTLAPYVTDVTDDDSTDISSSIGRSTGGLNSNASDPNSVSDARIAPDRLTPQQIQQLLDEMKAQASWDTGQGLPGVDTFGKEFDQPGAMNTDSSAPWKHGDIASEVARLQSVHGASVSGLRPGSKRPTDGKGKFSSKQARLSNVLQGI